MSVEGVTTDLAQVRMDDVVFSTYKDETQLPGIMKLMEPALSEPYSEFTYRFFVNNWPEMCILAHVGERLIGAIVCRLDFHKSQTYRGYIGMLAVDPAERKRGLGKKLVRQAVEKMRAMNADEAVLETELSNTAALRLYEGLGFVRHKLLRRYYLNGSDAYRLKLWFREAFLPGEAPADAPPVLAVPLPSEQPASTATAEPVTAAS